jgi:hypothetical protein
MKNPVILALLFLSVSCKKTYQCTCTTSLTFKLSSGNYDTRLFPNTADSYSEKMTHKQAKASCEHQKEAVQKSFTSAYTTNGLFPLESGESILTECTLTN